MTLLTTFLFRSDPVNVAPIVTPALFSLNHRTFRCLGLAGPPVLFSLNPSAGPRVSFTVFLPPRETAALHPRPYAAPPPPLLCRPSAAARAPLLLLFAVAPRATPAPRTHRTCAYDSAALRRPAPRAAAIPNQRRRSTFPISTRAPLTYSRRCQGSDPFPKLFVQAPSRCSRNCLLCFSSVSSLIYKGMAYTLFRDVKFLCTSSFAHMFTHILALIKHIRILSPIFAHAHIDIFLKSFSVSSISRLLSTRFHVIGSNQIFVLTLYDRWLVTRRATVRWLCRRRRSAPVRIESASVLRQS